MRKALTIFAILFGAGYLLGSMFQGFNTREWSSDSAMLLTLWFAISIVVSAVSSFTTEQEDAR